MSALKNLKTKANVEQDKDRLGGGSYILDHNIYLSSIEHAYISTSDSGAMALNVKFNTEVDGQQKTFRAQWWMTSGKDKGCKNTYEREGKEYYLPGFNQANHLCLLTTGKEIGDLETETKTLKIYNAEAGGEAPTDVDAITELFGEKVYVGLLRTIVDKTSKETGYQPTGETREQNEVDKLFHAESKQTVAEALAEGEPVFFEQWTKKYVGAEPVNKAKGVQGKAGGVAKGAAPGAKDAAPKKTLFGKKA